MAKAKKINKLAALRNERLSLRKKNPSAQQNQIQLQHLNDQQINHLKINFTPILNKLSIQDNNSIPEVLNHKIAALQILNSLIDQDVIRNFLLKEKIIPIILNSDNDLLSTITTYNKNKNKNNPETFQINLNSLYLLKNLIHYNGYQIAISLWRKNLFKLIDFNINQINTQIKIQIDNNDLNNKENNHNIFNLSHVLIELIISLLNSNSIDILKDILSSDKITILLSFIFTLFNNFKSVLPIDLYFSILKLIYDFSSQSSQFIDIIIQNYDFLNIFKNLSVTILQNNVNDPNNINNISNKNSTIYRNLVNIYTQGLNLQFFEYSFDNNNENKEDEDFNIEIDNEQISLSNQDKISLMKLYTDTSSFLSDFNNNNLQIIDMNQNNLDFISNLNINPNFNLINIADYLLLSNQKLTNSLLFQSIETSLEILTALIEFVANNSPTINSLDSDLLNSLIHSLSPLLLDHYLPHEIFQFKTLDLLINFSWLFNLIENDRHLYPIDNPDSILDTLNNWKLVVDRLWQLIFQYITADSAQSSMIFTNKLFIILCATFRNIEHDLINDNKYITVENISLLVTNLNNFIERNYGIDETDNINNISNPSNPNNNNNNNNKNKKNKNKNKKNKSKNKKNTDEMNEINEFFHNYIQFLSNVSKIPNHIEVNLVVTQFYMNLLLKVNFDSIQMPINITEFLQIIDDIFDIFNDESFDYDSSSFVETNYLSNLKLIEKKLPKIAKMYINKKEQPEIREKADEVITNLSKFIKYKEREFKLTQNKKKSSL
ncbi:Syo1p ASCRUDRAFT_136698 [Ascoidea rubescens DSM 1968]|uniref:ARM repeat-containing protein n=1 Tax=Ascoidea rubescens DSM 1968 TaxID=1344418 RepID=A0A1D2VM01_9ASCO|nr:hypothetical protein ASCRUDRAFT_136698 [Ascoidea rubescens DSM 1968]ODV62632.1 hypothetical protein ASCRUDRAFT_136698 [Ascoidea rubescens DSM 1968]